MTIAEEILKVRKPFQVVACEDKAIEIDQDWEGETTLYTFEDGSMIANNNGILNIIKE